MQIKSLLGALTVIASVAGAQATKAAPAAAPQAAPQAAAKAPAKAPAAAGYKKEVPAKLAAKAKITEAAAAATALASVPGGKIDGVELEEEDGAFIYSYDISVSGKKGVQEVHVDAMTGKIIKSVHEDPTSEKDEKAEGSKKDAKKVPAAPAVKKP
jgi:uncharacterized membrane protein YkoI